MQGQQLQVVAIKENRLRKLTVDEAQAILSLQELEAFQLFARELQQEKDLAVHRLITTSTEIKETTEKRSDGAKVTVRDGNFGERVALRQGVVAGIDKMYKIFQDAKLIARRSEKNGKHKRQPRLTRAK